MSEHRQPENGMYPMNAANNATGGYDVHAAHQVPDVPPSVYHPQGAAHVPAYDEYADPASAHGWQNSYDETAQLSPVVDARPGGPEAGPGPARGGRRRGGRRRGARRAARRPDRRLLAAAGAVGVMSLAAIVAGFSLGSPGEDDPAGSRERTGATAEDSAGTGGGEGAADPGAGPVGGTPAASAPEGAAPSASASGAASAEPSATPATRQPATTAPAGEPARPTASSPADGKPGLGHGRPKKPN
ncbi:hypothetical protein ABZZ79_00250 [Streptomyces sp. NPDC006458]|uniref:hypothetical protein n=1 Tax=Streptomyces sp. NPDC006458 TaxID=3154302 RepID=UPI0033AD5777